MSLKYRDGYLCGYENLEPLPVEILEDIVLRIAADDYLSRDAKEDLLKEYLEERKHKLDKAFRYTDENLARLREMNVLIEQQSIEAIRTAYRVYLDELAEKAEHPAGMGQSRKNIEEKKPERFRDVIDEYYSFINDYPSGQYTKEAENIFKVANKYVKD